MTRFASPSATILYPKDKGLHSIVIDKQEKITWCDINPYLAKCCPAPSDFEVPETTGIFQVKSKAETEFDAELFNIKKQIPCSHGSKEKEFFDSYIKWIRNNNPLSDIFNTPALIPETEIQIPRIYYEKNSSVPSLRDKMYVDFFWRDRSVCESDIVIEIDGNSHYEPVGEDALRDHSPSSDAERMRVFTNHTIRDRELALAGFEVFRFSIYELSIPNLDEFLHNFFDRVFRS